MEKTNEDKAHNSKEVLESLDKHVSQIFTEFFLNIKLLLSQGINRPDNPS